MAVVCNLGVLTQRGQEEAEEARSSQLAGGRFNEQRNSHTRLVLGGHKTRRRALPPTGVLRASLAPSPWFSHMDCPDGLNNTWLSQVCVLVLKWVQRCGSGENIPFKDWEGMKSLRLPGPRSPVTLQSCLLNDLLPNNGPLKLIKKKYWGGVNWRVGLPRQC